jgi:hypothetical protein
MWAVRTTRDHESPCQGGTKDGRGKLSEITDQRGGFNQMKAKGTGKFENVNKDQRNRKDKDGKACIGVLNIL